MKQMKTIFSTLSLLAVLASTGVAQMSTGVDMYSRYIWRGLSPDPSNAVSFQPSLSYASGDFSVGAWGAYSAIGTYAEDDIWASYGIALPSGKLTATVTDYYIPSYLPVGSTFFNYNTKKGSGSHTVEIGIGYAGGESFPLSLSAYYNVIGGFNDPDNSAYLQAAYPIMSDLNLTVGFSPSKSTVWYITSKASLLNVGLSTSKTIKVTESFSIPFNAAYIMNPYTESAYLVFGITL
jgi:hypothetical protein